MSKAGDRVCLGAIAGAFGVRGEVRLKPFTADPAAIADYGPLETEDGARAFEITLTRAVKNGYAARLSGIATREAAEALRGTRLYADRGALPALEEDEYYYTDLIGMTVVALDGTELGRVKAVQDYGGGDFLEVMAPGRKAPALLPFTREAAPHVDVAARQIVADPPDGVFDAETDSDDGADADAERPS